MMEAPTGERRGRTVESMGPAIGAIVLLGVAFAALRLLVSLAARGAVMNRDAEVDPAFDPVDDGLDAMLDPPGDGPVGEGERELRRAVVLDTGRTRAIAVVADAVREFEWVKAIGDGEWLLHGDDLPGIRIALSSEEGTGQRLAVTSYDLDDEGRPGFASDYGRVVDAVLHRASAGDVRATESLGGR